MARASSRVRQSLRLVRSVYCSGWESKWHNTGGTDINNPKVPFAYVSEDSRLLWGATAPAKTIKK